MHPLLNIAIGAARRASEVIVRSLDRVGALTVSEKGRNDFVSEIDRAAEQVLIATVRKSYPAHGFLAEESGEQRGDEYTWVIDPLDEPPISSHGFPQLPSRSPVGIAAAPKSPSCSTHCAANCSPPSAGRARSSMAGGCGSRSARALDGALIGTGFPFRENRRWLKPYLAMLESVMNSTAGVRRPGAASLDLAYVAAGRLDGFWEVGLSPWDTAAGNLLITEAGGRIGNWRAASTHDGGNLPAERRACSRRSPKCSDHSSTKSFANDFGDRARNHRRAGLESDRFFAGGIRMNLFRTQPCSSIIESQAVAAGEITLKRALTAHHLVMLGIGAVIGAGIFVISGNAAANYAGPAVILSFVMAGIACGFAGLCYAEFAAMLPVSGSAYSYAYATLGEFVAWFIGWMLILEYTFAAATVAVGWSGYFVGLLESIGNALGVSLVLPAALTNAPLNVVQGRLVPTGALINLPAVAIVIAVAALCYRGITQSATVNAVIVLIKVGVILLFMAFTLQVRESRQLDAVHPGGRGPRPFRLRRAWCAARASCSSPTSASMRSRLPPRRRKTRSATCRSASWARSSSARCIDIAMSAVMTGIMPFNLLGTAEAGRHRPRKLSEPAAG